MARRSFITSVLQWVFLTALAFPQFFITTVPTPWLDGKHVVFGEVASGKDIIDDIQTLGQDSGVPTALVQIKNCGTL
jgi:peptidylprolyl isomerase